MNTPKNLVAGIPLGGIIPRKLADDPQLVALKFPTSAVTERYRRLVAKLERGNDGNPIRTVVLTSATANEGKTLTSMNLALTYAEDRDKSTIVIDGDMRRPGLTRFITPQPRLGLSEVLSGSAPLEHALIRVKGSRLTILPAGGKLANPLELLDRDSARSLFEDLGRIFDRIVVDTPPSVPFSDAGIFGSVADGTLVVIRARHTAKPMIDRGFEALEGVNIIGAVLNDVEFTPVDQYYYYYDEYDPERYGQKDGR